MGEVSFEGWVGCGGVQLFLGGRVKWKMGEWCCPLGESQSQGLPRFWVLATQAKLPCLVPLFILLSGAQPGLTLPGRSLEEGVDSEGGAEIREELGVMGLGVGGWEVALRIS